MLILFPPCVPKPDPVPPIPYPHQFATALFSFLYHLASYDAGGEALVSCGMMEALLKVIKFLGDEQDQITFVTRAVRVVDLITNLDMAAFQSHSGLSIFIYRLEHEVDLCRRECPFVIKPKAPRPPAAAAAAPEGEDMETDMEGEDRDATEVVTVFVFQEPSLLSSLQDNGLTDVMLHALLIKDVPATREVLGSLPNVFSALCLNARGLQSFVQCQPFERLFKVLLSPDYLPAMRRRRSSDPLGDTASNLGSAVDELMRHQPTPKLAAFPSEIRAISVNQWGSQLGLSVLGKLSQLYCSLVWESTVLLLTFFICSVGFTSPMLFDERKFPYHLMLQKFLCSGGHNALFETFNWALSMGGKVPVAEGLEHPELPDGTGEFLDAWLMLVEKMVNPSTVLDSPHALPHKPPAPGQPHHFSALRFLVVTQKYLQFGGNTWRWFDDRSGRWCSYSASNNSTIDAAWRGGEPSVRFTAGRRRYTVQFTTMVQVVRSAATSGAGSTTSGVVSGSLGSREINYILRVLGPAACRSPQLFTEVATACVRIALPAPRGSGTASDEEFENLRIKGPNAVQLVKTTPVKPSPLPPIPDPIKDVIYDMLNALAAYHAPPDEGDKGDPKTTAPPEVSQLLSDIGDDMYQHLGDPPGRRWQPRGGAEGEGRGAWGRASPGQGHPSPPPHLQYPALTGRTGALLRGHRQPHRQLQLLRGTVRAHQGGLQRSGLRPGPPAAPHGDQRGQGHAGAGPALPGQPGGRRLRHRCPGGLGQRGEGGAGPRSGHGREHREARQAPGRHVHHQHHHGVLPVHLQLLQQRHQTPAQRHEQHHPPLPQEGLGQRPGQGAPQPRPLQVPPTPDAWVHSLWGGGKRAGGSHRRAAGERRRQRQQHHYRESFGRGRVAGGCSDGRGAFQPQPGFHPPGQPRRLDEHPGSRGRGGAHAGGGQQRQQRGRGRQPGRGGGGGGGG
ncbi:HECT, UBA and WWE domain containing 1, E3 ubiquitin protein ligase [Columba livia]|uniref:HECT, UBA and WWE domain containing 1, E3 ubiquitin protein ligase n=1 Tax=Columba livia TaxID=8932 RepID=A0A2I0LIQ2_COLLI|nr:HECT, UBA and WWE domain containing 1, E3 ubiquitin protein ligase [Columba livia]